MKNPSTTSKSPAEHAFKIINAIQALPEDEREEAEMFIDLLVIEKKSAQWIKENFIPAMKTGIKERAAMAIDELIVPH